MRWTKAGAFAAEIDLSRIDQKLHKQQIIHRFTMESNIQVLWVPENVDAEAVMEQVKQWLDHPESLDSGSMQNQNSPISIRFNEKPAPVTLVFVALCFAGAALYYFGDSFFRLFTFWDTFERFRAGDTVFRDISDGEIWRLITPIFLHFSPAHSIFNALSLWYLGSMVERHSGISRLLLLILVIGLVSNSAQAIVSTEYVLFGGMSGVVFGLLSYVWLAQRLNPACGYNLFQSLFVFMTAYMLLSTLGIFNWLTGGDIADTAHIVGYITGLLLALVFHLFQSGSRRNEL